METDKHVMLNQIVNHAIDYIVEFATSDISVDDVAEKCGYSKYYLERLFKAETGESIYSFIKRFKVEHSAFVLKVDKNRSVTDVGQEYGYSASNYATLFKGHFGTTPATFRKNVQNVNMKLIDAEEMKRSIRIEYFDEYYVLYERYKRSYEHLPEDWCEFLVRNSEYVTKDTIFIDITYDDPQIVDTDQCLYDICMTIPKDDPRLLRQKTAAVGITSKSNAEPLPNTMVIPGGKFAVYRYKGYPEQIYPAYQSIFRNWLSETGNHIDNRIGYDIYYSVDDDTAYMEMDICIPIK